MKKIGIAGFGFIGSYIFEQLQLNDEIIVEAIWEPISEKTKDLDQRIICKDLEELGSRSLDLIIETAHADVVKELWPLINSGADLMVSSVTCLSDPDFRQKMEHKAKQSGQKVYLPHGAVLGLDGLRDGRALIDAVVVTTTKHPKNLGMPNSNITQAEEIFNGSTSGACKEFPRNVNVHAAIALAGLGFDKTQSIIIADPKTNKMQHQIEVKGQGLNWKLEIESFSAGAVTGSYTPASLYNSLVTILSEQNVFRIV